MAPFDLASISGSWLYALIFLLIGMGFGAVLEMSGFGDSRRLAAQFYLRDMTVLKVMFTAIVTACVLIFLSSALGLLDFDRVWVNPTFLAPEIVGGLIMGVGFIVGGFCPGTSVVAASTLKIDGVFFLLGVFFGVFAFGETVASFEPFFMSTSFGRFTIPDWLGLPTGVVVVLLVLMALAMFRAAEISEAFFGRKQPWSAIGLRPRSRAHMAAAAALLGLAALTMVLGQPTVDDKRARVAEIAESRIANREVQVDPAEVVDLRRDLSLKVVVLDLRPEAEFNRFHLAGARRIDPSATRDPSLVRELAAEGDNTIFFLVGNGEKAATEAWRDLSAQGVLNLYVLSGGMNGWLDRYPPGDCVATRIPGLAPDSDAPAWQFAIAVGDRHPSAHPDIVRHEPVPECVAHAATGHGAGHGDSHEPAPSYVKKVKLQRKVAAKGGCG